MSSSLKKAVAKSRAAAEAREGVRLAGRRLTLEQNKVARAEDVAEGQAFADKVVGDKSLGRLTGGEQEATEVRERRLNALQGFDAPELAAARGKATEQIDAASEGALRRLKSGQAASGVRGATAGRQQADIVTAGSEQKAGFERELLIQNRAAQQGALDSLQRNVEFDLDAASREKFAQLATGLGFAQIGSVERGAEAAREAQIIASRSRGGGCFTGDTLIEIENGVTPIKDLNLGDFTKGGYVISVHAFLCEGYFLYNGVKVGGDHAVKHEGKWVRIKDVPGLEYIDDTCILYDIATTDFRIYVDGIEFADYDEVDNWDFIDKVSMEELNGNVD